MIANGADITVAAASKGMLMRQQTVCAGATPTTSRELRRHR
jgi:hypothetical protein